MSEVSEIQEKKTLWNLKKEHAQAKSKEATMSERKQMRPKSGMS